MPALHVHSVGEGFTGESATLQTGFFPMLLLAAGRRRDACAMSKSKNMDGKKKMVPHLEHQTYLVRQWTACVAGTRCCWNKQHPKH